MAPLAINQFDYQHGAASTYGPTPAGMPTPYWPGPPQNRRDPRPPEFRDRPRSPIQMPLKQKAPVAPLDALKRRKLPAWIREGLEKMDREKQKKLEQERIEKERAEMAQNDVEDHEPDDGGDGPRVPRKSKFDSDDEGNDESAVDKTIKKEFTSRSPSPAAEDSEPEMTEEEKEFQLMVITKTLLTEILLEVTNEEIVHVAKETHRKATRAPAKQLAQSSALASLTGLSGLGDYGSDESEDEERSVHERELQLQLEKQEAQEARLLREEMERKQRLEYEEAELENAYKQAAKQSEVETISERRRSRSEKEGSESKHSSRGKDGSGRGRSHSPANGNSSSSRSSSSTSHSSSSSSFSSESSRSSSRSSSPRRKRRRSRSPSHKSRRRSRSHSSHRHRSERNNKGRDRKRLSTERSRDKRDRSDSRDRRSRRSRSRSRDRARNRSRERSRDREKDRKRSRDHRDSSHSRSSKHKKASSKERERRRERSHSHDKDKKKKDKDRDRDKEKDSDRKRDKTKGKEKEREKDKYSSVVSEENGKSKKKKDSDSSTDSHSDRHSKQDTKSSKKSSTKSSKRRSDSDSSRSPSPEVSKEKKSKKSKRSRSRSTEKSHKSGKKASRKHKSKSQSRSMSPRQTCSKKLEGLNCLKWNSRFFVVSNRTEDVSTPNQTTDVHIWNQLLQNCCMRTECIYPCFNKNVLKKVGRTVLKVSCFKATHVSPGPRTGFSWTSVCQQRSLWLRRQALMENSHGVLKNSVRSVSQTTVDPDEVRRFRSLASKWWDEQGEFGALHAMNDLRVPFIRDNLLNVHRGHQTGKPLAGLKILDVGCGGGLLTEPLGRLGASVLGIDPVEDSIGIAKHHSSYDPDLCHTVSYRACSLEELISERPEEAETEREIVGQFDAIVASEVVEHLADLETFANCCSLVIKPGGSLFITTLNKTNLSWLLGIVVAENVLQIVPRGTHEWEKFISPVELERLLESNGFAVQSVQGMLYNPITGAWSWTNSTAINYALHALKLRDDPLVHQAEEGSSHPQESTAHS
ncbi:hypothetical protein WMY93_026102 [Mugilogobius chulae]|uniref:Ubiquinone biosynthesis O-methyltransferase, mitochondrial n=1 Tax=Mugilogobius chulae TaxID=88201 RepID=A0AAW0N6T0_9GOBI